MRAKLIIEGKEFPIEIQDPELEKMLKPTKKTGYERLNCGMFYAVDSDNDIRMGNEINGDYTQKLYESANYYSEKIVAENNARADKLMRQLRRFAVEHRNRNIDWCKNTCKYYVFYDHRQNRLDVIDNQSHETYGVIYFDSEEIANFAIETFHDELIWYFTEYKDSL